MTQTATPEKILNDLIASALDYAQQRQIAKANKPLLSIYALCRQFPYILWDSPALSSLSKAYFLMYHFETFESEEDNIEISHWAYFYAYRSYLLAIDKNEPTLIFDTLRDLVLIADECNENFIDTVARYFQPRTGALSQQTAIDSRMMATRIMPLVTYSFILEIEDRFHTFQDDELLEDACNNIEMEYGEITEKLTNDARNIAKLMFAYISSKIKDQDYSF